MAGKTIKFNSPIPPSVNKYLDKHIYRAKNGYTRVGFNKTEETLIYTNHMRNLLKKLKREENWETPDKSRYFNVYLTYYFHKHGCDPDNTLKLLLDNIVSNEILPDDSHIKVIMEDIYVCPKDPRVEVVIEVSDKIGIFKNEDQLNEFIANNCKSCAKHYYKKPCGQFNKFMENNITEFINFKLMKCKNIKEYKGNNK